jgi:hypothetical protein
MNMRKHFFSLFLLLAAFAPVGTISEPACAQRAVSPEIDKFYVESDNRLAPGAELTFTIEGTPGGKASVRISGLQRNIPLKEVSSGVYQGGYTIKHKDRITASNTVRATLRVGSRSAGETYTLPSEYGPAPSAAAAPAPAPAPQPAAPKIDRFTVAPIGRIEPGADLRFAMIGTPGAKASFTIEGVAKNVPMQEVTRGNYEGSYTIRRLDHFPSTVNIFGTLEANGQAIGARLNQALIADATPPVIRNISPRDGETVAAGNPTSISARFDDSGGVGVDASSVRVMVGGRDVTQRSKITPQFFNYREDLQPGRYAVEVVARDLAGNAVRYAWTFSVAPQPAPASLPLQILSHANNAQVSRGTIEIRGRTAPDARVDVQVLGHSAVAGLFGVTQKVYDQSLRADPNGNFAFTFRPQIAVPGTRYEITMNATKADLRTETQLVLFQQQ